MWFALIPSAIALTLVTTAEGLLVSRSYSEKRHYPFQANRDLLAFGVANIAAGAQGSFAVGSSTSRTAAMDQAGSRTQLPSLVLAVGTLLLLMFGTALLADIPSPAIGAVVAVAILPLLGIPDFIEPVEERSLRIRGRRRLLPRDPLRRRDPGNPGRVRPGTDQPRQARSEPRDRCPRIHRRAERVPPRGSPRRKHHRPGVIVIRLAAPLFFANASVFTAAVKRAVTSADGPPVRHLVLDMEAVTDVDVTGAEAFEALEEWLADNEVALAFSRVRPAVRARLEHLDLLTDQRVFDTNRSALTTLATVHDG